MYKPRFKVTVFHVWHGKHPYTSYPVTQGHEVSATVVDMGPEVKGFRIGDLVTVMPQVVCGKCYPCTHGMYNDCEELKVMGFQTTGMAGGTIGNLVGQALRAMGAEKVLLSEVSACRLETARAIGLETVNPGEKPLREAIFDSFGPDGADVIFECIGNGKTLNEEAYRLIDREKDKAMKVIIDLDE